MSTSDIKELDQNQIYMIQPSEDGQEPRISTWDGEKFTTSTGSRFQAEEVTSVKPLVK